MTDKKPTLETYEHAHIDMTRILQESATHVAQALTAVCPDLDARKDLVKILSTYIDIAEKRATVFALLTLERGMPGVLDQVEASVQAKNQASEPAPGNFN
jgi:hypothetical protein